jgi:hypothetical protein
MENLRNYVITDGELKQFADIIAINVNRDLVDFNRRGVTSATVDNLKALATDFNDYPTDQEYHGPEIVANEEKEELAKQIMTQARIIRSMAREKYHGKGIYELFGFRKLNNATEDGLYRLSNRIVRSANKLKAELQPLGLTDEMINNLNTLANNYNTAIELRNQKAEERIYATQVRIQKGNALFAEISRLCLIGQSLYIDSNEAKHNDYIISKG